VIDEPPPHIPAETMTAAEAGHPRAQYNAGCHYHYGKGVPKDPTKATLWWRKAAEQGYPSAQYNLGLLCLEQIGADESFKWMREAASNGHQQAQSYLGIAYFWGGSLVARDKAVALKWMMLSTKNNSRLSPRIFCTLMKPFMTSKQIAEAKRLADKWKPPPNVMSETNPP
jgi:TPR repeat protein